MSISLDEALDLTRTGDIWVFRGRSVPDRAIQLTTNSPVNHVGMSVVIEDLPPLMWHAELGRSLPDMWSGTHQRGVQLHDLRDAVRVWANRYGQRAWLRQLEPPVDRAAEDAVLRTIARLDGLPFPSTAQLAWRWAHGRLPPIQFPGRRLSALKQSALKRPLAGRFILGGRPGRRGKPAAAPPPAEQPADGALTGHAGAGPDSRLETTYCAEVVAQTYSAMGLLPADRRPNWYDPGRFWSGDDLGLAAGATLGAEIEVRIP